MPDTEMQRLLEAYREDASGKNRARWIASCERFFRSAGRPAVLDEVGRDACKAVFDGIRWPDTPSRS